MNIWMGKTNSNNLDAHKLYHKKWIISLEAEKLIHLQEYEKYLKILDKSSVQNSQLWRG